MEPTRPGLESRAVVIRRGDVFWVQFTGSGSEPMGRRPAVVIQHDRYNRSAIQTTVIAAITSNLRLSAMAGNVRLAKGEAGLSRACVVNVTQLATIDKARLTQRVGALSLAKRSELVDSIGLVLGPEGASQ